MQVKLTKSVITVGSWTLISRILGMVREVLLSTFIGAGPLLDAFVAAFRLPNIFRRFLQKVPLMQRLYHYLQSVTKVTWNQRSLLTMFLQTY